MSASTPLDYYHYWLGIPPEEQPPTHYRLLGIRPFESDGNVISNAADRLIAHIRTYQNGPQWIISQKLLNELSDVRVCLLKPDSKREYDEQLQRTLAQQAAIAEPPPVVDSIMESVPESPGFIPNRPSPRRSAKRRRSTPVVGLVLSMLALTVVLVVAFQTLPESEPSEGQPLSFHLPDQRPSDLPVATPPATDPSPGPQADRPTARPPDSTPVALVDKVMPSVVRLETGAMVGSGVIVDDEGLILTNVHLGAGAASKTTLSDGTELNGHVIGQTAIDRSRDLVLLKTKRFPQGVAIKIAEQLPNVLDSVVAFGHPHDLRFSVSAGIVSAIRSGQEVDKLLNNNGLGHAVDAKWIQHTAPVSQGNSGGPLVNMKGELVGLNTWGLTTGQSLNFAISAPDINQFLKKSPRQLTPPIANVPKPKPSDPEDEEEGERPVVPPRMEQKKIDDRFPSGRRFTPDIFETPILSASDWQPLEKAGRLISMSYSSGSLRALITHTRGKLDGLTVGRHLNGQPKVYVSYHDGMKDGVLKIWNDKGQPVLFAEYKKNQRDGLLCYFEEDALRLILDYQPGRLNCLRVITGASVVGEFAWRMEADKDATAHELLAGLMAAEKDFAVNEAEFKDQAQKAVADEKRLERRGRDALHAAMDQRARDIGQMGMERMVNGPEWWATYILPPIPVRKN